MFSADRPYLQAKNYGGLKYPGMRRYVHTYLKHKAIFIPEDESLTDRYGQPGYPAIFLI